MKPLILTFILASTLLLASCTQNDSLAYQEQILVFGTLVDIQIYDQDADAGNIESLFQNIHRKFHAWENSALTETNNNIQKSKTFRPDQSIAELIRISKTISLQSDELFNPAIGKLIELWGFHKEDWGADDFPSEQALNQTLSYQPSMQQLEIKNGLLTSSNRHIQLDFGGIAKGLALQKGADYLRSKGIKSAIINAGGDLVTIGNKAGKDWTIGIRHPRKNGIIAALKVRADESIFTSGDYERFYLVNGKRYHHIINPLTGYPATASQSATVIHDDPVLADAAATALFVGGPPLLAKLCMQLGIEYAMLIDNKGNIFITNAMLKRLATPGDELDYQVIRLNKASTS